MGERTMMRATNGDGERVGGVGRDVARLRQQAADHEGDLRLVGRPGADDGLLDLGGRKFSDLELRRGQRSESRATRRPSSRVERGLMLTNVSSTAASCGV